MLKLNLQLIGFILSKPKIRGKFKS